MKMFDFGKLSTEEKNGMIDQIRNGSKFEKGSVVAYKSGGPYMTLQKLHEDSNGELTIGSCGRWDWERNEYVSRKFSLSNLIVIV